MSKKPTDPGKPRKSRSPSVPKIRVVHDGNGAIRLVRAISDKRAIAHCASWTSHKASVDEVAKYVEAGIKIEDEATE